ncbi:MAG: response regulator [Rhodocyclaceae bacterium]|nr:response regulator [Rhodocyclaceae bacterium]
MVRPGRARPCPGGDRGAPDGVDGAHPSAFPVQQPERGAGRDARRSAPRRAGARGTGGTVPGTDAGQSRVGAALGRDRAGAAVSRSRALAPWRPAASPLGDRYLPARRSGAAANAATPDRKCRLSRHRAAGGRRRSDHRPVAAPGARADRHRQSGPRSGTGRPPGRQPHGAGQHPRAATVVFRPRGEPSHRSRRRPLPRAHRAALSARSVVLTAPRLLIVDDEAPARARLRNLLDDIAGELPTSVVVEAADGIDALEKIDDVAIDVALVDIRMPRMDGIELARHLSSRDPAPAVIFVTAYDQYAVKAFELSAVDYLLKPVKAVRLADALRKLARSSPPVAAIKAAAETIQPGGRRQLRSLERGKVLLVPVADILYLKAELKYVTARTREREFLLEESLAQLEGEFAARFLRIHRNCLVARDAIAGFERDHETADEPESTEPRWALILRDIDDRLPVSRRQWPQVKAILNQ